MSAAFASEKRALGECDRCGFVKPLRRMRTETELGRITHVRVCPSCEDEEHPQNWLGRMRVVDPQGLRNPRPPKDLDQVRSRPGWDPVGNEAVRIKCYAGTIFISTE